MSDINETSEPRELYGYKQADERGRKTSASHSVNAGIGFLLAMTLSLLGWGGLVGIFRLLLM